MRKLWTVILVISIAALGAAYVWRTYLPEQVVAAPGGQSRSLDPSASVREAIKRIPSERQDIAVMVSIASSVISAIAALLQTWLTARALAHSRRPV